MTLVPLEAGDVDGIVEIAGRSFPTVWARDDFEHFLTHASGFCFGIVSLENGRRRVHAYFLSLLAQDDVDVISIATAPEDRGRGYAECLLRHVLASSKVSRVFLEVDVNNVAAIELYKKLRFTTLGTRRKYYAQKTDALVMRWSK